MKRWSLGVASLALAMVFAGVSKADDVDNLRAMLMEQSQQMAQMQARLAELEANQRADSRVLNERLDSVVAGQPASELPAFLRWVESIEFGGDFRYRHELIDREVAGVNQTGRNRHRIRARLTMDATINDQASVHFRLASGSNDPTSTNQTLGGAFSSKSVWLDRAYFNWRPDWLGGASILGGKMPNPFRRVGGNELIWDGDVNPEGLAAKHSFKLTENDTLTVTGGGFWVEERGSASDTSVWGVSSDLRHAFSRDTYALAGLGYFNYGNIKGRPAYGNGFRNTLTPAGEYANDYDLVEIYAEAGMPIMGVPFTFFGDFVCNAAANNQNRHGYLLGVTVNKASAPGTWQFTYDWRDLERDAVFGALTHSDSFGGGTDGFGHRFEFKYQIDRNMQTALTYFLNKYGPANDSYQRLQADLAFSF